MLLLKRAILKESDEIKLDPCLVWGKILQKECLSCNIHSERDWPSFLSPFNYSEPCCEKMAKQIALGEVQRTHAKIPF